jgi:hypothetical protein
MAFRVSLVDRIARRHRTTLVQTGVVLCALLCALPGDSAVFAASQAKTFRGTTDRVYFKVTDSENDLPVPQATICVVYRQKVESGDAKREMELKTDKNGIAEFPKVEGNSLAVSVAAKGYRTLWRWIQPNQSEELIRIRVEKWASSPK